jgi:hypothetical protein
MKEFAISLILMLLFVMSANAQKVKAMTGTVAKTVGGGRWTGIVIKVGDKKYGIQMSYEPSAGDETRGERGWQVKSVGNFDDGREVRVFYTKIDCTVAYEANVPCWLKATKLVEVRQAKPSKNR